MSPRFDNVTFYKGRIFGNVGSRIVCSEYNKYNGWTLDTSTDIGADNAWMSTTTANTNADGDIVTLREYLGRVSVFKSNFMQEVYGGSNPFSIQDVYAVGTPFRHGVCEAYGRLCFAGKAALRTYAGSFPRVIGEELGVNEFKDVHMIGDERCLFVKTGNDMYEYDFIKGVWSEKKSDYFSKFSRFIALNKEFYFLTNNDELIKMNGENYASWSFTTDAMTENTLNLKRLQRIRITYELGAGSDFAVSIIKSNGIEVKLYKDINNETTTVLQRGEISVNNVADWFLKLKFSGLGYFKLISLDLELKDGSTILYEGTAGDSQVN